MVPAHHGPAGAVTHPVDSLVGRELELAALDALVGGVARRGGALVLAGEPGIGKSALLEYATARAAADGARVLRASGAQSEAQLPFAGLHQLLRPVLDRAGALPARQRDALLSAMGMGDAAPPERFLIALAVLTLLSEVADDAPLVLAVDDAHWLDEASAEALAFVGRRLESDAVVLLAALREGTASPFAAARLPELRIGGLDGDASAELLAARAPELEARVRARVLRDAQGNPLALTELAGGGGVAGPEPPDAWPLTARLERAFADRLVELPAGTRELLLVAALHPGGDLAETLEAASRLAGAAVGADVLAPAEEAGLVVGDAPGVRFRHPLVRSALVQRASPARRQAVHASLAEVLAGDPDRRAGIAPPRRSPPTKRSRPSWRRLPSAPSAVARARRRWSRWSAPAGSARTSRARPAACCARRSSRSTSARSPPCAGWCARPSSWS